MNKFVVCCDVDNCLNNLIPQMLKMYNERYGTNYSAGNLTSYALGDCFPLEEAQKMQAMFLEKELWDSLEPLEGAIWGLQSLINEGYKVYAATSTHYINFAWKVQWFIDKMPFFDTKNIICIHDKSLLKCDVLIEDCYSNLTKSMAERVLIDHPWNQSTKDYIYGINRAYNWEDVIRFVNKIYKDMEW
ncbi:MAG: hypothetical protein ACI4DK_07185 [Lachnospiraceae bacterium]